MGGLGTPGEDDVSLYAEWEVGSGQGLLEIVRAVEPDDGPATVEAVLDTFAIAGDEGNATVSLK